MYNVKELSEIVDNAISTIELPESPSNLYKPIKYLLSTGGKRIRPVLVLSACNLFNESIDKAIFPSIAVEVFHNFTLVHDDIMDNATIRRGKETIHKKWNTNIAILAGDAMSIIAYKLLCRTDSKYLPNILSVFNTFSLGICEGQQYDMDFEAQKVATQEEYTQMIELKTAVLLRGALQIGAIIGEAKANDIEFIGDFGLNLGLAFQLQDDLLDVYGDPEIFGKKEGGDIVANKKTILTIKAFSKADSKTLGRLKELYSTSDYSNIQKVNEVTQIFNDLDIKKDVELLIQNYFDKAKISLEKISTNSSRKLVLTELAADLMTRKK